MVDFKVAKDHRETSSDGFDGQDGLIAEVLN
jgi:hypothetical protein